MVLVLRTLATGAAEAATLLLLASWPTPRSVQVNGQAASCTRWSLYGFDFDALPLDIAGQMGLQVV